MKVTLALRDTGTQAWSHVRVPVAVHTKFHQYGAPSVGCRRPAHLVLLGDRAPQVMPCNVRPLLHRETARVTVSVSRGLGFLEPSTPTPVSTVGTGEGAPKQGYTFPASGPTPPPAVPVASMRKPF